VSLLDESQIRVILLDIEGTTTSIDFVYKTLFPYASRKLESFLREHVQDPEIQCLIQDLCAQHDVDERGGLQPLVGWMIRKSAAAFERRVRPMADRAGQQMHATESLQGKIWQQGFTSENAR